MDLPDALIRRYGRPLASAARTSSTGSIWSLRWGDGRRAFLKEVDVARVSALAGELAGLQALQAAGARCPQIFFSDARHLCLQFIGPATAPRDDAELGRSLARVHAQKQSHFGFPCPTWCGATRQDNRFDTDGHRFYGQRRLGALNVACRDAGLLDAAEAAMVDQISERLPELVPAMPACLLHGDLWGGNVLTDTDGQAYLIDPACYYGWAEAELAMTRLFGGFTSDFYAAYTEAAEALASDWQQRIDLHNLFHLLNHLRLFGGAYRQQVLAAAQSYL